MRDVAQQNPVSVMAVARLSQLGERAISPSARGMISAVVCLATLATGQALASNCPKAETTDARLLLSADYAAFVRNGEPQIPEGKVECVIEASIKSPVKGELSEGEMVTVVYPDSYGCNQAADRFSTFSQYYKISSRTFGFDRCASVGDHHVVTAFYNQKISLEKAATASPRSVPDALRLMRFYVGWRDGYRARAALPNLLEMAPTEPEVQLLEVRLQYLSAGRDLAKLRSVREKLAALRDADPVARILLEETDRLIRTQSLQRSDGAPANHVKPPPSTLKNIDLTGRDMTGFSLDGIILTGLVASGSDWTASLLSEHDFSGVDFSNTIFTEAVLARVVFKNAELSGAKFAGALLVGADFSGASMRLANLRGADATEAKFAGADLRGADLRGAELVGADFTGARYDCTTRFGPEFNPKNAGMARDATCAGGEGSAR